ncbi:adrenodoxin-like [Denticeps clupeoides]|uniref:2Fe-2S ferredoxin-type domain-containing protein n=1 Tax=Denticeps clupeoides TaxID=299321 RepID=A0A8C3Z5J5_9TELE|nr:adrenodoxin-like [Denticeps clupeoides]XP_028836651.1 adrenodoxin-like [Denticeps clupeoides]
MSLVFAAGRLLSGASRVAWRKTSLCGDPRRTSARQICSRLVTGALWSENKVTVNFINRDGERITVQGSPGESLLDVVVNQDLDFDGFGACEGTLACSTCHLVFEEEVYHNLGPVTDEELDMLDLSYGLTDTSRLGCQICLSKSLDGMTVRVPESVMDIRQSGGSV